MIDARIPLQAVANPVNVLEYSRGVDARHRNQANALSLRTGEAQEKARGAQAIAQGVLSSDNPAAAYGQALERARAAGMNVEHMPAEWGADAEMALRMITAPEEKRTALMQNLESMGLKPGTPEYKNAAMRALNIIKDPRVHNVGGSLVDESGRVIHRGAEKAPNDPSLIREMEAAGFRRGTPEFQAEYQRRTAKSNGVTMSLDENGRPVVSVGGPAGMKLGRAARNTAEKDVLAGEELTGMMARLKDLAGIGEDGRVSDDAKRMFTYRGRFEDFTSDVQERLGYDLPPEAKEARTRKARFVQVVDQLFNAYRKEITGAAAAVAELERLKKSFLNSDMGVTEFEAAYSEYIRTLNRVREIRVGLLARGIDPKTKEGGAALDRALATGEMPAESGGAPDNRPLSDYSDEELQRMLEAK